VSLPASSYDLARATDRARSVLPRLRGALARLAGEPPERGPILELRTSETVRMFLGRPDAFDLAQIGCATPDHVLRTKPTALVLREPRYDDMTALDAALERDITAYARAYDAYFAKMCAEKSVTRTKLDPWPRVILLPGLGLCSVGKTRKEASIAADVYEHTIDVMTNAAGIGTYAPVSRSDLFDVEYWSLEQAKLGRASQAPLAGQVALVTGGAGAVGLGIARRLVAAGAHVALADLNETALGRVREQLQVGEDRLLTLGADVTDERSVREMVRAVCARFGGLDLCVPNAGIAHSGPLLDTPDEDWRRVIEVNATGYFLTIREAARVMVAQGLGGNIVINASKNVFAPGAEFAPYSASKAAGHQLGKVAALELAKHGIRVNMVNADAIFGDAALPSGLWQKVGPARARARGLQPDELQAYYRQRNLLKAEVRAEHVGNAVVFFASNQTPTTGATLPIDGGIPEAFPR
jgi:NAD(P)-dependent dehydrogenase (short-subunit alcohol dehydrogenase family)